MSAREISDLIARLEAATGPDRALDAEIARMFGKTTASGIPSCAGFLGIGAFTGSIDAAVALAERVLDEDRALAVLAECADEAFRDSVKGTIRKLPISIIIATLKAKEASDEA